MSHCGSFDCSLSWSVLSPGFCASVNVLLSPPEGNKSKAALCLLMEELFGTSFRNSGAFKSFHALFFPRKRKKKVSIQGIVLNKFFSCTEIHLEIDFFYKKLNIKSTIQYSKSSKSKMSLNIKINVMKATFLFGK